MKGAELALELPKAAKEATKNRSMGAWFVTVSSYTQLSIEEKKKTVELLRSKNAFDQYRAALLPLIYFYPSCPLSFLFDLETKIEIDTEELEEIKRVLESIIDRKSVEATFIQANAVYIGFILGKLVVSPDVSLARFPEVQYYPNTEVSKQIASSIRATVNTIFGIDVIKDSLSWPNYFWNHGLDLEKCNFIERLTMDSITGDQLLPVLQKYVQEVEKELDTRWESWSIDLSQAEKHEVIGALLARIVTLATELAVSPQMWNEHIAPLILRTMVDAYITLAWIFNDPLERSRKFLLYGLGQAKLSNEHRKAQLLADGIDPQNDPVVKATEGWINSQRYLFLTEVNLGNWAGIDTRKMAEEAGCIDLYNYVYTPFSAATHNMWHHIGRYNLKACLNPLHGLHYVPVDYQLPSHTSYLRLAAKYTDKAFQLFNEKTGIKPISPTSYDILLAELETIEKPEEWT